MAKTVNASVLLTRDGNTTVQNFPGMGYATFVALQSSLGAVLATLQAWNVNRVAELVEGRASEGPGGDCDLKLELRADHGGGTSEVVLGYTGLAAKDADEITASMMQAISAAVPQQKKA